MLEKIIKQAMKADFEYLGDGYYWVHKENALYKSENGTVTRVDYREPEDDRQLPYQRRGA
jgi:hypothetical protein